MIVTTFLARSYVRPAVDRTPGADAEVPRQMIVIVDANESVTHELTKDDALAWVERLQGLVAQMGHHAAGLEPTSDGWARGLRRPRTVDEEWGRDA